MSLLEVFEEVSQTSIPEKPVDTDSSSGISKQASPPRWQLEQFWASTAGRRARKLESHSCRLHSLEDEIDDIKESEVCKDSFDAFLCKYVDETPNRLDKMDKVSEESDKRVVNAKDIGEPDVTYTIEGLQAHELPVIGIYVDPRIYTGFYYKVRPADMPLYHFGGEALKLQMIGRGYGKRLEFQPNSSSDDTNITFWSDNNPEGFAFSIKVLFPDMKFKILEKSKASPNHNPAVQVERVQGHNVIGDLNITSVEDVQQELSSKTNFLRDVTKEVAVRGQCSITTRNGEQWEDIKIAGVVKTSVVSVRKGKEKVRTEKVLDVTEVRLGRDELSNCALKLVPF